MKSITLKQYDISTTIEADEEYDTIFEVMDELVVPALLAQGYAMETIIRGLEHSLQGHQEDEDAQAQRGVIYTTSNIYNVPASRLGNWFHEGGFSTLSLPTEGRDYYLFTTDESKHVRINFD